MNITAADYEKAAFLAERVADEMMARLAFVLWQPRVVVDVGCGTGKATRLLRAHYPEARVYAVDQDAEMLAFAESQTESSSSIEWIHAAASRLPFSDHTVELLFANFLFPWCEDVPSLLAECRRVLCPGGLLVFSALGPDTLRELPDTVVRRPRLIDMHDIGDQLIQAKWFDPVLDVDRFTLSYRNGHQCLQELVASQMIMPCDASIAETLSSDALSLTAEVIYAHAWVPKADVSDQQKEQGVWTFPLAHLRGSRPPR